MQLNIFKKPEQREFCDMNKSEKKNFLACDLVERMIRVEQKVRGSMGEGIVPYNQTEYFKELHPDERKRFSEYLKKKDQKRKWKFLPFVVLLGCGAFIGTRITGNVVGAEKAIPPINLFLLAIFLIGIVCYWIYVLSKRKRINRLDRHFKVIENIVKKRKSRR